MKTLDEEIRDAMMALENSVPQDYFEEFPARVDARLEVQAMASDTSEPRDDGLASEESASENTGLHDIKEMAENTKQRISRRISTQSDVEESLLGSSSVGLKAVVLPAPGKDKPKYDTASPVEEAVAAEARGGIPLWSYAAVAAVAAVAVIFFVTRGGEDKGNRKATSDRVALNEPSPTVAALDPAAPPAVVDESEKPEPTVAPIGDGEGVAADADEAVDTPPDEPAPGGAGVLAPRKDVRRKPAAKSDKPAKTPASKKSDPKKPADPKPAPKPRAPGDQSIEDMLAEASGGAAGPDKDAAKAVKKTPTNTELGARDIRKGMSAVAGKAKACYAEHQQAGSVGVAVTVAPDGKVTKASPTGAFASGDKAKTGKCVAAAVKSARFPPWDGKAKSFKYSYLLSD